MAAKQETAEQKLLKMIEASQAGGAAAVKAKKEAERKQSLLSLLRLANRSLVVIVLVVVGLICNEFYTGSNLLAQDPRVGLSTKTSKNISSSARTDIASGTDVKVYLASVDRRNIFQPFEKEEIRTPSGEVIATSAISKMIEKIKLVGISWFDSVDSASVMIEDTEKKMTYFLKKGEKIGSLIVKTIYADSVKLGYENEEIIIRYDKPKM